MTDLYTHYQFVNAVKRRSDIIACKPRWKIPGIIFLSTILVAVIAFGLRHKLCAFLRPLFVIIVIIVMALLLYFSLPDIAVQAPDMTVYDGYRLRDNLHMSFSNIESLAPRASELKLRLRAGKGLSDHPNVRFDTMCALRYCVARAIGRGEREKLAEGRKIGGVALSPQNLYRILCTEGMFQYFHFCRPVLDAEDNFRVNDELSCRCKI